LGWTWRTQGVAGAEAVARAEAALLGLKGQLGEGGSIGMVACVPTTPLTGSVRLQRPQAREDLPRVPVALTPRWWDAVQQQQQQR
jgi:hypothetical protein